MHVIKLALDVVCLPSPAHATTQCCVSPSRLLEARLYSQAKAAAAEKPVEEVSPKFDSFDEVAAAGGDDDAQPGGCVACCVPIPNWTVICGCVAVASEGHADLSACPHRV